MDAHPRVDDCVGEVGQDVHRHHDHRQQEHDRLDNLQVLVGDGVEEELAELDVDSLSPREALDRLYELKQRLQK